MKLWKKTCKEVKLGRKFGVKDPISCCLPSPKRSTSKRKITHHFFASYIHAQNNEFDFQTNKTFVRRLKLKSSKLNVIGKSLLKKCRVNMLMISPKTLKNPCLSEIVTSGLPSTMILDVRVLLNPVSNVALFAVCGMSSDRSVSLET